MVEVTRQAVNHGGAHESTIGPAPGDRSAALPGAVAQWLVARSARLPPWRHLSMRLLPPRCLGCGQGADLGAVDYCSDCLVALPWRAQFCMGESMGAESTPIGCSSVLVPWVYAPPVDAALRDLKFHGDLAPARVFGGLLAAVAAVAARQGTAGVPRRPAPEVPDLLVPVPLHPDRLHERGFNQAAHLARAAAGWLDRPCAPWLLERRRATRPQTSLHATERRDNVAGAFVLAAGAAQWLRRFAPRARHVALVDDVLTTGATIAAAAVALEGFETVSCWAVARPLSTSFTARDPQA